jgi:carbonic anhydrase
MDTIETLNERNKHFAAHQFTGELAMMPALETIIIGCADPRVDPTDVLGLELGDAAVIRNIGGRITPATLQTMAMLRLVAAADPAGPPGAGWNLIVLHHTDCGINRLTSYPDLLAEHFGIEEAELDSKHISDPWASVATDVAALKANPFLPAELIVSGLVYDVETGLVEQVVGPELLRDDRRDATT